MIPCNSTRRRRPFFRRRVSDQSRDNRSTSWRASEREIVELQPSFVRPSFVRSFTRSGATADHLGWKNKELDPGPKSCIERLGTWVKPAARRIGLGVSSFLLLFSFATSHPRAPPDPLGPGSSSPTFLPPFVPLFQYQHTPPFPSFTSLFGTNLFCLYALFIVLGTNSGLHKFAILTYPSQCFVLEKFCRFFWPKNFEIFNSSSLNLTHFEFFYKDYFSRFLRSQNWGEKRNKDPSHHGTLAALTLINYTITLFSEMLKFSIIFFQKAFCEGKW
jgi:hypothetical protein